METKLFTIGERTSKTGNKGLVVTFADFSAWYSGDKAALLKALESGCYRITLSQDGKSRFINTDELIQQKVSKPNAAATLSALGELE